MQIKLVIESIHAAKAALQRNQKYKFKKQWITNQGMLLLVTLLSKTFNSFANHAQYYYHFLANQRTIKIRT